MKSAHQPVCCIFRLVAKIAGQCLPVDPHSSHLVSGQERQPSKPFRINTCKSVSKQTTLTPFRINTYEKKGGVGVAGHSFRAITSHQYLCWLRCDRTR